jgi:hypothetical protein
MTEPAKPRTAATLMLARDGTDGLELFMVVRHHEIEFASGAIGVTCYRMIDTLIGTRLRGEERPT